MRRWLCCAGQFGLPARGGLCAESGGLTDPQTRNLLGFGGSWVFAYRTASDISEEVNETRLSRLQREIVCHIPEVVVVRRHGARLRRGQHVETLANFPGPGLLFVMSSCRHQSSRCTNSRCTHYLCTKSPQITKQITNKTIGTNKYQRYKQISTKKYRHNNKQRQVQPERKGVL